MSSVFVTGGTGFLGSYVVHELLTRSDRDVVLMVFGTGWAGLVTSGIQQARRGDPFDGLGPLLVVPAATGAVVSAFAPVLDVPVTHSSAALSLGLVGAYVGGSAGALTSGDPVPGALIGGNAGLSTGALLVSPFFGVPPTTVALADAGGILGGAAGAAWVLRSILAEADLLMAVNGYPTLEAVRDAGVRRVS